MGFSIDGEEYQRLVCDYWELYKSNSKGIPLMPGVLDVLNSLNQKQIKQYILSASDRRMVLDQISAYGIRHFFEDIIAPQDGYALGKVELAKQWMSDKNIPSSNVIMIGDTLHDYETAKAIKVDCALVNKGHQNLSALAPAPSIMVFDSISELVNTVLAGE